MTPSKSFKTFKLILQTAVRPCLTFRLSFPIFPIKLGLLPWLANRKLHKYINAQDHPTTKIEKRSIAGVTCYLFSPKKLAQHPEEGLIIYIHGGAFTMGSAGTYLPLMTVLANDSEHPILFIDYSLAPAAKYPHAAMECFTVYEQLLKSGYSADKIVIGGDSAGGNLVAGLLHRLRATDIDFPAGLFLESPFTDLTFSGESFTSNWITELILPLMPPKKGLWEWWMKLLYAGLDADSTSPYLSPLFGSFNDWPPISISYSLREQLKDDSTRLIKKARDAGVEVNELALNYTPHANYMFLETYDEARISYEHHLNFIRKKLNT